MISGPPACDIALPKRGLMNVALLSDLDFKTNYQSAHAARNIVLLEQLTYKRHICQQTLPACDCWPVLPRGRQ
jgi:hypothetical protein